MSGGSRSFGETKSSSNRVRNLRSSTGQIVGGNTEHWYLTRKTSKGRPFVDESVTPEDGLPLGPPTLTRAFVLAPAGTTKRTLGSRLAFLTVTSRMKLWGFLPVTLTLFR